jgi:ketosteroid isomerase-like protein
MNRAPTYPWTRIRCWVEQSNNTEILPLRPFCRGCIIATHGYDFWKGQVHDEIKFCSDAPSHAFPYFASGKGKVALLAAWKATRVDYEFLNYAPFLVVAGSDDTAVIVVKWRVKAIATNRLMEIIVADFLRFRDDRIIEFHQYMDSVDATQLWLGREVGDLKL